MKVWHSGNEYCIQPLNDDEIRAIADCFKNCSDVNGGYISRKEDYAMILTLNNHLIAVSFFRIL